METGKVPQPTQRQQQQADLVLSVEERKLADFFTLLIEIDRREVGPHEKIIQESDRGSLDEGLQKIALGSNKTRHPRAKIKS